MPSGPKKRRAAKRKNEAKQSDEFTTVTIPIEELAKGAVWHDATSVDKEFDKDKNIIVDVPNEFKAQAKETDVLVKLTKSIDLNTIEEVADNSNGVQEKNEVPLLDVTLNEDILVSNDDPVLSNNAGCIMENVESGENLQGNESCVAVCNDTKEADLLFGTAENMFDLLSDDMTSDYILERYHHLFFLIMIILLWTMIKIEDSYFRDVLVAVPGEVTDVEVLEADTVGKRDIGVVADVFKVDSVMENVIEGNEESLLNVNTNDQDKEISKDVMIVSQNSSCIVGSVESDVAPEVKKDTVPLVSVNVMSNESIKEEENNVMIHDQSTEAVEEMNNAAQLVSELPVVFSPPSASAENIGQSDSNETGTVSPSTEDKVTDIPSNLNELLDVLQRTVPRATEKQVYFACPMHCNAECSFSQLLRDELLENVEELKIAIRSLKEDLEKALDKLDSISY
ncbi:hypothetical protein H5410_059133 [Solanum commersonii]|uniref:Uncharacterized protein n=1 Tax=Solanum commersonii TaxID=4109 RepID=A0A9J5W1X2_SOLCO|nr:hypothetical protein H5410_059133 [Solanum commersonii]